MKDRGKEKQRYSDSVCASDSETIRERGTEKKRE